jgi:hypothetical protein
MGHLPNSKGTLDKVDGWRGLDRRERVIAEVDATTEWASQIDLPSITRGDRDAIKFFQEKKLRMIKSAIGVPRT